MTLADRIRASRDSQAPLDPVPPLIDNPLKGGSDPYAASDIYRDRRKASQIATDIRAARRTH